MSAKRSMRLLVGDNPFHGISHLSQERSRARGNAVDNAEYAAELVTTALENGADGFMFSVSETTLSILQEVCKKEIENLSLHAIVPYAYEYVRLATQAGGITGLAKKIGKQAITTMNVRAIVTGLKGVVRTDPISLMKAYMLYEISRIRSATHGKANLDSMMLHEIITEVALALNLDWFFRSYIDFMWKLKIQPGFETRNFAYLVRKFKGWNIDFRKIAIVTAFNRVGFQMNPSKIECEEALSTIPESRVTAMSILAAGYLKPLEAIDYIRTLTNLKGVVVGVSKEQHARETFGLLKERLGS